MPSKPASPDKGSGLAVHALAFISGASALVFELLWIRTLGLYFGTTVGAITTVVATYTAGIALGSVLFGHRADRSSSPLRLYASIELGIGVASVVISVVLLHGSGPVSFLARFAAWSGPASSIVRAAAFSVILIVPTTLMGGTLPVLARARARAGDGGRAVGLLYAFNTAGAVVGALLPDGLLIPVAGLTMTALTAGLGNLVVALVARRLPEPGGRLPVQQRTPLTRDARVAIALCAVSGFSAIGYEVLWSRVLEHVVEGLVIGFSVLLAVYLVSIAVGARLSAGSADRVPKPLAWAALCLAGSGLLAFAPIPALPWWTGVLGSHFPEDPNLARAAEAHWWLLSLANSVFLEGPSCLLMGVAFPFLAAASVREGVAGRGIGWLYAANAVAGVLGSFGAAFLLLPRLGVERALFTLSALAVVAGTLVLFSIERAWRSRVACGAMGVAAALLGTTVCEGRFLRTYLAGPAPLYVREGATTSVAVVSHTTFGSPTWRELKTPGVSMSDTRFSSRRYMGLMAHLPMFLAREHRSALLICFGVGNTARSLLSHPDLERLDVVDISREVLDASPYFAAVTSGDPLLDGRTRVTIDDGRHYLLTTDRTYDVITSEPPPPNHAGVVNLYSREYYRAARRSLRPGGILAQWLPVLQLTGDEMLAMVGAMAREFPYIELRYGFGYQWIVLGSDSEPRMDAASWTRIASDDPVARDLASIGVRGEPDLAATRIQDNASLRAVSELVAPVDDDLPSIEYPILAVPRPPRIPGALTGDPADALLGREPTIPEENAAATMRLVLAALPLRSVGPREFQELAFGTSARAALRYAPEHPAILALLDVDDISRDSASAWLYQNPKDVVASLVVARRAYYDDDFEGADARLASVVPDLDHAAVYWLLRGGCARARGRWADATSALQRAVQASRDPRFRSLVAELAENVTAPWRPELGPLASPGM